MRNNHKLVVFLVCLGLALASTGLAQTSAMNEEVSGTVTDPSGAAIAGATVNATNTVTGYKLSTKTADTGLYRLTLLPLGTYEIDVQASGFGAAKRTGIPVTVGATASVDIALPLAGTSTTVDVTAMAAITEPNRIDL